MVVMSFIPDSLPDNNWDDNGDLVSPCATEKAVVKSLATVQESIRAYMKTNIAGVVRDKVYDDIISGMISVRLHSVNSYDIPDLTGLSRYLGSICKDMIHYEQSIVIRLIDHYVAQGTTGFDDVLESMGFDPEEDDICFQLFLYFVDIKCAVYHWIIRGGKRHLTSTKKPSKRMCL